MNIVNISQDEYYVFIRMNISQPGPDTSLVMTRWLVEGVALPCVGTVGIFGKGTCKNYDTLHLISEEYFSTRTIKQ